MLFKLNIDYNSTFYDAVTKATKDQFSYLRHQKYPVQTLISEIKEKINTKENLYNISVSYQNSRTVHLNEDVEYDTEWLFGGYSSIPLLLHICDVDDTECFTFMYDYQIDIYNESQIKDIHNRLLYICKQVINNKDILIKDIELATNKEKDIILNDFNNTFVHYDKEKTILDLFAEQVEKNPEKHAIICDNKKLTYKELDSLSNNFAGFLQKNYPFEIGSNISVILDRSIELVIVTLAILKCGGSYVLIDPSHPTDRQKYMIDNSDSKYIISNLELEFENVINIKNIYNNEFEKCYKKPNLNSENTMYLLYTSGSTGNPKAVTVSHRNFHNYLIGISNVIDYTSDKKVLSMASISFDVFGYELWVTLLNGLSLVLATSKELTDFNKVNELIIRYNVNIIYGTPSKIQSLMSASNSSDSLKLLSDIGIGGESLTSAFLNDLTLLTFANIYNMYGPTEATVGCCCKKIEDKNSTITIGKPMSNVEFYVLDKDLNLCPVGIKGELYISGDGISKGYYKKEELTKKSFLKDLFFPENIMYKTGDIVSWTKDGELIFYGRADSQIKIRGYRIELSEIEKVLLEHPFIKTCAVINYNYHNREFLCAYYTSDFTIQNYELKVFLAKKLPNYMIPSYFIALSALPLTVNGKIDRKNLPSPFHFTGNVNYVKPETELQYKICNILEDCLSVKNISIEEDFNNLGIDSLSIIKMQSKLSTMGLSVPTQYFYDYSNVKDLCFALENTSNSLSDDFSNDIYPFLKHDLSDLKEKNITYKNILLTGCTGFLGIHILDNLLQSDNKIYCLVRSSNYENAKKRIISMFNFYFKDKYSKDFIFSKIEVIVGDITYSDLGIPENSLNELGKKIDLVIHSAALVKHLGKYSEFKKLNLDGTKNVAKFCIDYNIPLSYISTTSVSGDFMPLNTTDKDVKYTEENFFIGQNYNENYYIKSKLLTEEYILNQIKAGSLHANIFRVGNLTARYKDGIFQYNIDSNAFYNKLQFIIKNKIFFESGNIQEFDMSPVDDVASAVINIIKHYGITDKIFHVFNPNKFTMKNLIDLLNVLDCNIKIVSDNEFYKKISTLNLDSNSFIISDYNLYTNLSHLNIKTTCDITLKYLKNINISYHNIDLEYLKKILNYIKNIQFI